MDAERQERLNIAKAREDTPEHQSHKRKYEEYEKQDERAKAKQRAEDPHFLDLERDLVGLQKHKMRYMFRVFDPVESRGKTGGIKFDHAGGASEGMLHMRINKNYFFNELNLSRKDLLMIPMSFLEIWKSSFVGMVKVMWKFYLQTEKSAFFNMMIRSVDMISLTFDIRYNDLRTYRIRWSPFEFRPSLTTRSDYLMGYFQAFSLIQESKSGTNLVKEEFYSAQRLFFLDDLTDDKAFSKIAFRINLFHQMYCISRAVINLPSVELEEWGKRCYGQFYYSTTRLKKFSFTFPIKPFRRGKQRKEAFNRVEAKLDMVFYCDKEIEVTDSNYSLLCQLHDWSGIVHPFIKEEIQ